jgi:hypothetical protein
MFGILIFEILSTNVKLKSKFSFTKIIFSGSIGLPPKTGDETLEGADC